MRSSSGLSDGMRAADRTWRSHNTIVMGKVTAVYPQHHTCDIAVERGGFLRNVSIAGVAGGTTQTQRSLPQVLPRRPTPEPEGVRQIDDYVGLGRRDTMAIVAFVNGNVHQPVCWLLPPDFEEGSFGEHNLAVSRQAGDSYQTTYALTNPSPSTLNAMVKNGSGSEDSEDDPAAWELPQQENWEHVFPDRRRLGAADTAAAPAFEASYPLGLETYLKVGYGYDGTGADNAPPPEQVSKVMGSGAPGTITPGFTPLRDFQETPSSARPATYPDGIEQVNRRPLGYAEGGLQNFDQDTHPWRRHRENKIRFARGLRLNQRWGTHAELTRSGDLRLLAEGLSKNVHPEMDAEQNDPDPQAALMARGHDWGNTYVGSRIEERHTAKGTWAWFRKRQQFGGRLEDLSTVVDEPTENDATDVRRWGHSHSRTQRTWQALSRMEARLGARGTLTLAAGAVDDPQHYPDGVWSRTEPAQGGDDPRYQDRLTWRNPDSDERGDITIRSLRGPLTDFGEDRPSRGRDDGGEINLITEPVEGNHALIDLAVHAAEDEAILRGYAQTGLVHQSGGDNALVDLQARAYRDRATAQVLAKTGQSGRAGDGATAVFGAMAGRDNAGASLRAVSGQNGSGSGAHVSVEADAADDNATAEVIASTDRGNDATVNVHAEPANGTALIDLAASTPDRSQVAITSDGNGHGSITITGNDEILIQALRTILSKDEMTHLGPTSRANITIAAPVIKLKGKVIYDETWP